MVTVKKALSNADFMADFANATKKPKAQVTNTVTNKANPTATSTGVSGGSVGAVRQPTTPTNNKTQAPITQQNPANLDNLYRSTPTNTTTTSTSTQPTNKQTQGQFGQLGPAQAPVTQQKTFTPNTNVERPDLGVSAGARTRVQQQYQTGTQSDQNLLTNDGVIPTPATPQFETPQQKAQKELQALEQKKREMESQDYAMNVIDYTTKTQEQKDYLTKMQNLQKEQQAISQDSEGIIAQQRMRQQRQQVDNLLQRTSFMGNMGNAAQSAQALKSTQNMVIEAETVYNEMVKLEQNRQKLIKAGVEIDNEQFARQLQVLQDDLDSKVSKSIQDAITNLNSLQSAGQTGSKQKVAEIEKTIMQSLDNSIMNFTSANNAERRVILDRYNAMVQFGQTYVANSGVINKEVSQAQGFYVDMNGEPMIGANGMPIQVPQEAQKPLDAFEKNGKFYTVFQNPDGTIRTDVQDLYEEPSYTIDQATDILSRVTKGELDKNAAKMLLPSLASQIDAITQQSSYEAPKTQKIGEDEDGRDIMGYFDNETGKLVTLDGVGYQQPETNRYTPAPVPKETVLQGVQAYSQKAVEGQVGGQCGAFVNRYIESIGGPTRMFVDPFNVRKSQANSNTPTVGSVAIYDYSNVRGATSDAKVYGHVGIVESVNKDGSYTVVESNQKGDETVTRRTLQGNESGLVGFYDPTKGTDTKLLRQKANALVQGMDGTGDERKQAAEDIIDYSLENNVSLEEAKSKLGHRTRQDNDFIASTRDEFTVLQQKASEASKASQGLNALLVALDNPNPITDIAAVVGFLKTIDPSSVAKEAETEQIRNAKGIIDSMLNMGNELSGETLTPNQRQQMRQYATDLLNITKEGRLQEIYDSYSMKQAQAEKMGISREGNIFPPSSIEKAYQEALKYQQSQAQTQTQQPVQQNRRNTISPETLYDMILKS